MYLEYFTFLSKVTNPFLDFEKFYNFKSQTKSDHPFWTFWNNFTFFPPMNLSNQYVLDLWLIFKKPIRFGIEKLKGKKEK